MKNLYVVDFGTGAVKLGIANNLKSRVAGVRSAAGITSPVNNLFTIQGTEAEITKIEQAALTLLSEFKTNGEWFAADFQFVVNVVKETQFEILREKNTTGDCFDSLALNFVGGAQVSLTDIAATINKQREADGKPPYQLGGFLNSKMLADYIDAASKEWNIKPEDMVIRSGKSSGSTIAHVSVGVLLMESADIKAKAKIHKILIDGWNNETLQRGGTEFFKLNAALSSSFGDNADEFINIAKLIRERILGADAKTEDWNSATVAQTHLRYDWENKMCDMLRLGVIRDYEHAKEIISKL